MIYDKQINRKDYDFFTFSNIRGRAGRLGQHHVGNVFLFHGEPIQTETEVDAPLFGDLNSAPDDMLIYLEPEDRGQEASSRYEEIRSILDVTPDEMRVAAAIGLDKAAQVQDLVLRTYRRDGRLNWSGYPTFDNLVVVCEIIAKVDGARAYGLGSARQLAYYIAELRKPRLLRNFFHWHMRGSKPEYREGVFRFLRGCEYGLPQITALIELFARKIHPSADYSLLEAGLPTLFRPAVLKHLDEQGVPFQISERFYRQNDNIHTLTKRLIDLARAGNEGLSRIEIDWILTSLSDD